TFLDDAPLEERRTRAVALRRGLPADARDLAKLDPDAIARVRDEARLAPRDAEELHDALQLLGVLRPSPELAPWHEALVRGARAPGPGAARARGGDPPRRARALPRRARRAGAAPARAARRAAARPGRRRHRGDPRPPRPARAHHGRGARRRDGVRAEPGRA